MLTYRHGDVGLVKASIPATARKITTRPLALGEVTGHSHRVMEADIEGVEMFEMEGGLFMRVTADGGVSIVHEEHGPITVAPGDYEIRIAQEYDEESDFRPVVD